MLIFCVWGRSCGQVLAQTSFKVSLEVLALCNVTLIFKKRHWHRSFTLNESWIFANLRHHWWSRCHCIFIFLVWGRFCGQPLAQTSLKVSLEVVALCNVTLISWKRQVHKSFAQNKSWIFANLGHIWWSRCHCMFIYFCVRLFLWSTSASNIIESVTGSGCFVKCVPKFKKRQLHRSFTQNESWIFANLGHHWWSRCHCILLIFS